jgi:hypothetical protein
VFRNGQSDHRQVTIAFRLCERRLWLKNQTSNQKNNFSLHRRYNTILVFGIPNSRSSGKSVSASTTLTNSYTVSVSEHSDASRAQERLNEPMDVETPFAEASVFISSAKGTAARSKWPSAHAKKCLWFKHPTIKIKKKFPLHRRYTTTFVFDIPNSRSSGKSVSASTTFNYIYKVSVSQPNAACRAQERLNELMDAETPFAETSALIYIFGSLLVCKCLVFC